MHARGAGVGGSGSRFLKFVEVSSNFCCWLFSYDEGFADMGLEASQTVIRTFIHCDIILKQDDKKAGRRGRETKY